MGTLERSMQIEDLRPFAGHVVRVSMADGTELAGTLRTELLTDRSISVYLAHAAAPSGTVLYIDDIASVRPESGYEARAGDSPA
jgi:hypothetical protein